MSKKHILPAYTDGPTTFEKDTKNKPPPFEEPIDKIPIYFKDVSPRGWTIVINNRFWTDGFRLFVSKDASEKFDAFKKQSTSPHIIDLQRQGIGIPLLKAIVPLNPATTKFLTFRRYYPNLDGPFDVDKNYYDFCVVRKHYHIGYNSYVFNFVPDRNDASKNFSVTLFSHSTYPIHDYLYNGQKHRWVDESYIHYFAKLFQVKFGFKHTILLPNQPSLCDNFDGKSDKLTKSKDNPFLSSYFKSKFNFKTRVPKPEYYGPICSAIVGEAEQYFKLGYAEIKIDDMRNFDPSVDYNSILSVDEDVLVMICIATVLKRQKDIIEDAKKRNGGG
ncbi:uncharacterized protein KGF55_000982 [Candida pseudojiufengensis]|uniref:uncharacterized protein n=1 Tax=Candida pseudojiufengensis TaxID=497109 RepID=UPI0022250667|nr:uncharacterized protein KGF55_000982 [Candida pseudojiufengensis]KAI5965620.1 hypothetical protein KGF55_000982 [Candida pseudojiufengensis]